MKSWGWLALAMVMGCDQTPAPAGASGSAASSTGPSAPAAPSSAPAAPASASAAPTATDPAATARALATELGQGKWADAAARVQLPNGKALSDANLKQAWEASVGPRGAFKSVAGVHEESHGSSSKLFRVAVKLETGTIDVMIGALPEGKVNTLRILSAKADYVSAPYSEAGKFEARDIMIGEGALALPGTLTVPKGASTFPIVILVHGSGGGDRDESNNAGARPFRDIAEGLASKGIAVLRWDKRSGDPVGLGALKKPLPEMTVEDEYLNDIAAAVETAKKVEGVDPARVVIVGHSMGAWLVPWLLQLHKDVFRGVLLAGNSRHMSEIVIPQLEYIARLDDKEIGVLEKQAIDAERAKWKLAADPKLPLDTPPASLPFNAGPKYWLSLNRYDVTKTAKEIERPLLILQGGRDYQVTEKEDFAEWKKELAGRKDTEFKLYPKLNHAFVPGEGMATPTEYETFSGHVDPQVIEDVAAFVSRS